MIHYSAFKSFIDYQLLHKAWICALLNHIFTVLLIAYKAVTLSSLIIDILLPSLTLPYLVALDFVKLRRIVVCLDPIFVITRTKYE